MTDDKTSVYVNSKQNIIMHLGGCEIVIVLQMHLYIFVFFKTLQRQKCNINILQTILFCVPQAKETWHKTN